MTGPADVARRRRPGRRAALRVLIALAIGASLSISTLRATGQSAPVSGGTLVVAISADPGHLNPAITTGGPTHTAAELLYNGLVGRDAAGTPIPELAERWSVEQGGAVYRFTLRDGISWHDGARFTAADVKFSFEEVLLKYHARTRASVGAVLAAIETPDDRTVIFRFKQPYAPLLLQLDATEAPIVARHVYQGTDPQTNPANAAPIGTGPFRFVSYQKGAEIRLERNPAYFKRGLPHLDALVMRIVPDASVQVLVLESGEVDFLWGVPGPYQSRFGADRRVQMARTGHNPGGSNCIMTLSFNLDRPLLLDSRTRRALGHAVDRAPFVAQILFGEGQPATAPISSGIPWAHASGLPLPRFDRAAAATLLDAAGWRPDGTGPRLSADILYFPAFAKYAELLRQQLAAVGINLTLRPLEPAVFGPTVFTSRAFDTALISYCNGPDPEIGVGRMYHSSQIGPTPFSNAAGYRNAAIDVLFDEAARTLAPDRRGALYRQAQQIAVQDLPYLPIAETLGTRAWSARCGGFKPWTGLFAEAAFCRR